MLNLTDYDRFRAFLMSNHSYPCPKTYNWIVEKTTNTACQVILISYDMIIDLLLQSP